VYRASALQPHEVVNTGQVVDPILVYPPGTDFLECYEKFLLPMYLKVCNKCDQFNLNSV
jgi:hypothetical protein